MRKLSPALMVTAAVRVDDRHLALQHDHELVDGVGLQPAGHRRAVPHARGQPERLVLEVVVPALHRLAGREVAAGISGQHGQARRGGAAAGAVGLELLDAGSGHYGASGLSRWVRPSTLAESGPSGNGGEEKEGKPQRAQRTQRRRFSTRRRKDAKKQVRNQPPTNAEIGTRGLTMVD